VTIDRGHIELSQYQYIMIVAVAITYHLPSEEQPFFLASSGHVQMPVFSLYTRPSGHEIMLNLPSTQ